MRSKDFIRQAREKFSDDFMQSLKDSEKGNMPVDGLKPKVPRVPFEKRRVGIERFYDAKQENVEIVQLIRIPENFDVLTQDVCLIGNLQYGIYQIPLVNNSLSRPKDLTLKRLEEKHELAGI